MYVYRGIVDKWKNKVKPKGAFMLDLFSTLDLFWAQVKRSMKGRTCQAQGTLGKFRKQVEHESSRLAWFAEKVKKMVGPYWFWSFDILTHNIVPLFLHFQIYQSWDINPSNFHSILIDFKIFMANWNGQKCSQVWSFHVALVLKAWLERLFSKTSARVR